MRSPDPPRNHKSGPCRQDLSARLSQPTDRPALHWTRPDCIRCEDSPAAAASTHAESREAWCSLSLARPGEPHGSMPASGVPCPPRELKPPSNSTSRRVACAFTVILVAGRSEYELRASLHQPGRRRAHHLAERSTADVTVHRLGSKELSAVENIEGFQAELQGFRFGE